MAKEIFGILPEIKKNMKKIQIKICFIIIIVLIAGLVLSYYLMDFNRSFKQTTEEIKIKEFYSLEPEEIFWVSGEIKEIIGENIILEAITPAFDSLGKPNVEIRTIKTTNDTEFVETVQKSQEEIIKETEIVLEKRKNNPEIEIPIIESFKEEQNISFSDLEAGDTIKVEAEDNIKGKTEFTAKKITKLILFSAQTQNQ